MLGCPKKLPPAWPDLTLTQAFADFLAGGEQFDAPMEETYQALSVDPASINTLESYLSEYFNVVLKKLKDVGATPKQQSDFYI